MSVAAPFRQPLAAHPKKPGSAFNLERSYACGKADGVALWGLAMALRQDPMRAQITSNSESGATGDSSIMSSFRGAHATAKSNLPLRLLGYIYVASVCIAQAPVYRPGEPAISLYAVLVLLWPIAALLHALFAKDSKQAEQRNLLVDSVLMGMFTAEVHYSLASSGSLIGIALNNALIGGTPRLIRHLVIFVAASLLWGWQNDFAVEMTITPVTVVAFVVCLVLYTAHVAFVIRRQQRAIRDSKQQTEIALDALNTANIELAESRKNEALGALVAGLAHELNTPLGVCVTMGSHISVLTHRLEGGLRSGQLSSESLEKIIDDATQATDLLSSNLNRAAGLVKTFRELSAERSDEAAKEFDLAANLKLLAQTARREMAMDHIKLSYLGPENLQLVSYPKTINRVVMALIDNAHVHAFETGDGGNVTLELEPRDDVVSIQVRDDGQGLSETIGDHLFDPFITTRRNRGSLGIGLSVVYNLVVQKLGGRVAIDKEITDGFAISIFLPWNCPSK